MREVVKSRQVSKQKIGAFMILLIFVLGVLWQYLYQLLEKNIVVATTSIISVKLLRYEMVGIFVIFILGFLWHFLYESFGEKTIIGLIAPVNESMWEHWKMGLYPILVYSLVGYIFVGQDIQNFWFNKFIGFLIFELICYSLIAISDVFIELSKTKLRLVIHIGSYFLGVVGGQIVSYIMASLTIQKDSLSYIAFIGFFIHIIVITIFTFNPPKMKYFRDIAKGEYGVYKIKDKNNICK